MASEEATGSQSAEDGLWDPALRRRIRKEQRKIIEDVHKQREDITLPDQLLKHVKNLDKLLTEVVAPKEAAVDSEGFRLISAIGREQVEATHGSLVQFDTTTYAEKLVTYMGGRRGTDDSRTLNWARLGSRVVKTFRRPPATNFMFGALELQPVKKKKARDPQKRVDKEAAKGPGTRPKELLDMEEEEESTTKDVQHIFKHIARACRDKGRVGYFQYLLDPDSFSHTVENMFHFSFLIKDGRMGVTVGGDGVPYIYIPSNLVNGQSTKTTKNQVIVTMTMDYWKKAIGKFKISEAMIPLRITP